MQENIDNERAELQTKRNDFSRRVDEYLSSIDAKLDYLEAFKNLIVETIDNVECRLDSTHSAIKTL